MKKIKRAVLVTTAHKGVFFGYSADAGETVRLARARNCIYWSTDVHGFLGLAAWGPTRGCRIGPRVSLLTLHAVTSVTVCSSEAVKAWEAMPWSM